MNGPDEKMFQSTYSLKSVEVIIDSLFSFHRVCELQTAGDNYAFSKIFLLLFFFNVAAF